MKMTPSPAIFCVLPLLTAAALAREPANLDEAKKCVFFVQTFGDDNKPRKHGTGFVMETEGTQWIYTNAHVIEGAKRIEFTDSEGKAVTGLGRFACYAKGTGTVELTNGKKKTRYGEDGVRIELTSKRELAFAPAPNPASYGEGTQVTTLGDNDGDKVLEVLDGSIVTSNAKVLQSTCQTRPGSSGGPLIGKADYKVIGLNTWGVSVQASLAGQIWQGDEGTLAGASILGKAKWLDMKAGDFLKSSAEAMKFRDTVRAMYLVYLLTPQESGFKIDPRMKVYATNLTFEDAFKRFDEDDILRPLIRLNRQLEGRGRDIGVNSMELVKIYSRALQEVRRSYVAQKDASKGKLAPYFLTKFEQTGFYEAGDWLAAELAKPQSWFEEKAKLGGSMPVGRWFNLRPLADLGK